VVTRSRAPEGRGISVAPEVQIEPEIETRPEQEIATCEEGLGAARSFPTDTVSLFTFSDKPEVVAAHTIQEVTETSHFTTTSQTSSATNNLIPPPHTTTTTTVTKLGPFGTTLGASLTNFGISVLISYISSTGCLVL